MENGSSLTRGGSLCLWSSLLMLLLQSLLLLLVNGRESRVVEHEIIVWKVVV